MLTRGSARPTGGLSVSGIQSATASPPLASSGGLNPNISIVPSNSTGASFVNTPGFTVPITVAGAFVKLAPAVGDFWSLETDASEFSLALTGAHDGQLLYTGTVAKRFLINGMATLYKAGGTIESRLAIFVNDVIHNAVTTHNDVSTRHSTRAAAPAIVVLNPGDRIDMRVTNEDDTDDILVESAFVSAISGGVI